MRLRHPPDEVIVFYRMLSGQILHRVIGPKELVDEAVKRDHGAPFSNAKLCTTEVPYGAMEYAYSVAGPWTPIEEAT